MEVEHLKNLGASLVREFLFRTGLKCTLKCMDDECPRSPKSFNNRLLLARELRIEHLVNEYKQNNCPAKSVLEIMLNEFLGNNRSHDQSPKKKYFTSLARISLEKWSKNCVLSKKASVQRTKMIDVGKIVWFYRQLSDRGVKIDFPTLVNAYCDCFGCDQQTSDFRESDERVDVLCEKSKGRHKSVERDDHRDYRDPRNEYEETIQETMAFNRLNPRKYPPAATKNALRDKEEILLDSLSAFRSRTSYDNRTRLGPNKENTFQNLKRSRSASAVAQLTSPSPSPSPSFSHTQVEPICDNALRTKTQFDRLTQSGDLNPKVNEETKVLPESSSSNINSETHLVSDTVVEILCEKESNFIPEKVSMEEIEKHNLAVNEQDDSMMSLTSLDEAFQTATKEDIEPVVIQISSSPKTKTKCCNLNRNIDECRVHQMFNNNNGNQNKLDDIEDAIDDGTEGGENIEFVPLRLSQAVTLKKLILGSAIRSFPLQWMMQSFVVSTNPKLRYGFVQNKGGACGVLASVQGHLLKWLLFQPQTATSEVDPLRPTRQEVRRALALALSDILWRAGGSKQAVLTRSNQESHLEESLVYRPDGITDSLHWRRFHSEKDLQEEVENNLDEFTSPLGKGCLRFVISAILSSGIQSVLGDMDDESTPLLGPTGMCSLELVNLLLTGRAVSNVFDNDVRLDTCLLRGVAKRSDIGFLSIFEHFNSCQVGSNLKTPRYPIWLVNSENHFSVVFSSVKQLVSDWRAERQFHLYHYDGLVSHEETVLAIDTTGFSGNDGAKKDNVPVLELCLKTKWKDAIIHWSSNSS